MVVPWKEVGKVKPVTSVTFARDSSIGMFRLAGLGFIRMKVPFSLVATAEMRKVSPPAGSVPEVRINRVAMSFGAVITIPLISKQVYASRRRCIQ